MTWKIFQVPKSVKCWFLWATFKHVRSWTSLWPKNKSCYSTWVLQLCFRVHSHAKFLSDVQLQSNIQLENDDLHYIYDLETKLALVMNTKVVHNDILNMFKLFLRSHKHFIHWLHIKLSRSTYIASLKDLIMQSDLHEHCSTSHPKCS